MINHMHSYFSAEKQESLILILMAVGLLAIALVQIVVALVAGLIGVAYRLSAQVHL